jgi:hypothetical protein
MNKPFENGDENRFLISKISINVGSSDNIGDSRYTAEIRKADSGRYVSVGNIFASSWQTIICPDSDKAFALLDWTRTRKGELPAGCEVEQKVKAA